MSKIQNISCFQPYKITQVVNLHSDLERVANFNSYYVTVSPFTLHRLHGLAPSQTSSLRGIFSSSLLLLIHKLVHNLTTPSQIICSKIYFFLPYTIIQAKNFTEIVNSTCFQLNTVQTQDLSYLLWYAELERVANSKSYYVTVSPFTPRRLRELVLSLTPSLSDNFLTVSSFFNLKLVHTLPTLSLITSTISCIQPYTVIQAWELRFRVGVSVMFQLCDYVSFEYCCINQYIFKVRHNSMIQP